VFIFIGHLPNSQLFQGQLAMDEAGYLVIDKDHQTSISGVFAAGEIADSTYKQVVTSAGMGAAAAMRAIHYLDNLPVDAKLAQVI
jgi:thioredoxin reductase (NADPH)